MYCTKDVSVIGSRLGRYGTLITQSLQDKCRVSSAQTLLKPPCSDMSKRLHTERGFERRAGARGPCDFHIPTARKRERKICFR